MSQTADSSIPNSLHCAISLPPLLPGTTPSSQPSEPRSIFLEALSVTLTIVVLQSYSINLGTSTRPIK